MKTLLALFCLLLLLLLLLSQRSNAQQQQQQISDDLLLPPCSLSSYEMAQLGPNDVLEPCIVFQISPPPLYNNESGSDGTDGSGGTDDDDNSTTTTTNTTTPFYSLIPLVQVTPSNCGNQRDGAVTAVQKLNADNNGQGVAIGFYQDHFVQFTLTSVVAGNPAAAASTGTTSTTTTAEEEYNQRHDQWLRRLLETKGAPYIIGTCSFSAEIEKGPAGDFQAMVLTQVGPPGFYAPENNKNNSIHPYVFGFHINSDTYPLPNVQSLGFLAQEEKKKKNHQNDQNQNDQNDQKNDIPIRVIYRNKSEFFYSTCQSAIDKLRQEGFTDIKAILYDHSQDEDGDGEINQFDQDFLESLADEACPPPPSYFQKSNNNNNGADGGGNDPEESEFHPALFVCTLTEHDIILQRWLETGCQPQSLWLTAATWGWADTNPQQRPYIQGGGQWHASFDYSDKYFTSGQQLLEYNEAIFGYLGNYDQVVSYAIPVLFAQHLQAAYRVTDVPTPLADFANAEGRERLRRAMLVLNVETIFGPVSFDENQRNIGRGAAGTQWLPSLMTAANKTEEEAEADEEVVNEDNTGGAGAGVGDDAGDAGGTINKNMEGFVVDFDDFRNALVSPFLQAEASTELPAASAIDCPAGYFVNSTARVLVGSLLASGCEACPVDTYTIEPNKAIQCTPCPENSGTDGMVGSDKCYIFEDNLLSGGILALGYVASSVTWILAIGFMAWIFLHRHDAVVKVSQVEFLTLICVGAMISSSTVIALSLQAGLGEDTSAATAGCMAAPFLYTIGWVLQYSSLSAKTYRLFQTMLNTKRMKRRAVTALHTLPIVIVCLLIDLIIVIVWTVKSPLVYERTEESREVNEEEGIVTISTVGRCVSSDGKFWQYVGPILGFHFLLVVSTNILLCNVRDIADRYQEQKYVAMASALMLEILLVGIPVLVSVNDSADATFIVLTAIIALDDIAVLSCIFGPKISFQRKGLQEGVQFGESIMRESHKRASMREYSRRSFMSQSNDAGGSSQFFPQQAQEDPMSSASPDKDDSSSSHNNNKSGYFPSSEQGQSEEEVPSAPARRDSFVKRIQSRPLFFRSKTDDNSAVESIVEETHEEVLKELSDSSSPIARSSSSKSKQQQQPQQQQHAPTKGYMMTPAGLVDSTGAYASLQRSDLTTSSVSSSVGPQALASDAQQQQQPMYDPQKAMEEQARMMEMTKQLMEDHARMMKATAELMNEHKRMREELRSQNYKEAAGNEGPTTTTTTTTIRPTEGKAARTVKQQHSSDITGTTEEGSNSSAESPQAAVNDEEDFSKI